MRNPHRIVYNLNVIRNALRGLTAIHSRRTAPRHRPAVQNSAQEQSNQSKL
jgi:hypothetical protein